MVLSTINLKELPDNSVMLLEEDLGDINRLFIKDIVIDAIKEEKEVIYVTNRLKGDINRLISCNNSDLTNLKIYPRVLNGKDILDLISGDVSIIENFSEIFIDASTEELMSVIYSLIDISREEDKIIILTSNMGIISERSERIIRSIVDGVIQILTEYSGSRINRFINIPKLNGGLPLDRMIPFTITKQGISLDTRERF